MDEDTLTALFGPLPPAVVPVLQTMLSVHSISAEELFYKWESYCMKMGPETRPTPDSVAAFRKDVLDQLAREMRARSRAQQTPARRKAVAPPPGAAAAAAADWMMAELTPSVKRKSDRPHGNPRATAAAAGQDSAFARRPGAGEVVEVLNAHIARPEMPLAGADAWEGRVRLVANMDIKRFAFRTMHQKLTEASEVLDDRIDDMMAVVQAHHGLADEQIGNPSTASPSEIVAVGRIASDSLDGRLNAASVVLEASRSMGAGARVPLRLDALRSFSFFPGQIVAVRGVNASGDYLAVREVLAVPPLPLPASPARALREAAQRLAAGPLSIFVAAGPYTGERDLRFEALGELCERAARERPDVLILTGPFVDAGHALVRDGDFELDRETDCPIHDLFRERVSPLIRRVQHSMVILVPAVADAISPHVAYPQDALKKRALELPANVKTLPNPATFSLNEVVFAVSTPDILQHLAAAECRRAPAAEADPDPVARLARALVAQRSFYPLFPPARGVNLDVPYVKLADFCGATPDVLVLPGALAPTAKVVDGVVVVNAGCAGGRGAQGTWVKVWVRGVEGVEEGAEAEEGVRGNRVFERARVEVVRV